MKAANKPQDYEATLTALLESEENFRKLVEYSPYCIHEIDLTGLLTFMNPAGLQMMGGCPLNEIVGAPYLNGVSDLHRARIQALMEAAYRGEASRFEFVGANGQHYQSSFVPMTSKDQQVTRLMGLTEDITERKQVEIELDELNEQLQFKVHQSSAELESTLRDLQRAQQQLEESEKMAALGTVVAGISHEINTSVGICVTAISHIHDQTALSKERFDDNQLTNKLLESYLATALETSKLALSSLQQTAKLVASFKSVAVDQSSNDKRTVMVKQYITDILLAMRPHLKRCGHRVVVDIPAELQIETYPSAIYQIISNLVLNSLTHGFPEGQTGTINIDIEQVENSIHMQFRDDGIGIDAETKDRIFEPFFTTKRGSGGSGIGMHIVYNVVTQNLGGTIECSGEPGHGISFQIVFPLD